MYDTIAQTIRTILLERSDPVPELTPETRISASGLDSLDVAAWWSVWRNNSDSIRLKKFLTGTRKRWAKWRVLMPVLGTTSLRLFGRAF